MRLTNTLRQAFVSAAMQDVPSVDYREQIQSIIQKATKDLLPEKVKAALTDPESSAWLRYGTYHVRQDGINVSVAVPSQSNYGYEGKDLPATTLSEVNKLTKLWAEQKKVREKLQTKLQGVAASCTTRQALLEMLPEFEKYLPADEAAAKKTNLPALANVVTDFVKAGWPKQNKGKIAKAKTTA